MPRIGAYTDCGGGLCTTVGGMCDACADALDERRNWHAALVVAVVFLSPLLLLAAATAWPR